MQNTSHHFLVSISHLYTVNEYAPVISTCSYSYIMVRCEKDRRSRNCPVAPHHDAITT